MDIYVFTYRSRAALDPWLRYVMLHGTTESNYDWCDLLPHGILVWHGTDILNTNHEACWATLDSWIRHRFHSMNQALQSTSVTYFPISCSHLKHNQPCPYVPQVLTSDIEVLGGSAKSNHLVQSQTTAWAQSFRKSQTSREKSTQKSQNPMGTQRSGMFLEAVQFAQRYAHTAEF